MILCAACRHVDGPPVPVVDLIREFDRAEKRPPAGFQIVDRAIDGTAHPAIVAPVPSRLTIPLPLPRRGVLRAFVALEPAGGVVRLRVGISDDRIYERLTDLVLSSEPRSWVPLSVDLSAYAGWKWSLFYRPERVVWHLVLAADSLDGRRSAALWGSPEIVTDNSGAREYAGRRARMH